MSSRFRSTLFALVPAVALFGAIEGVAQVWWLYLEGQALDRVQHQGESVVHLPNDAINFMKVPSRLLGYRLVANLNVENAATNSRGFFQREPVEPDRRPGSLRVIVIGDSSVMGNDVDRGNFPGDLRQFVDEPLCLRIDRRVGTTGKHGAPCCNESHCRRLCSQPEEPLAVVSIRQQSSGCRKTRRPLCRF